MELKNTDMPDKGWWDLLPKSTHKWIRLARFDRPIGSWLLLLPCLWTLPLLNLKHSQIIYLFCIFFIGSFVMRSAGCVINDLWDKNIDRNISRTRYRPLANGEISIPQAFFFLFALLSIGLICLLNLNQQTWIVGFISIPIIILYPLAKRFTQWPQIFLGLAFSWGVPTAWVAGGGSWDLGVFFIYLGSFFWVIGYDTIYGCQDRTEDKIFGVYNTAITAENYLCNFIKIIYFLAVFFFTIGGVYLNLHFGWFIGLLFMSIHLYSQTTKIKNINQDISLKIFQSNKIAGLFLFLGSGSKYLYF